MAKDGDDLQTQRDANRDAALRAERMEDRDFTLKERESLAASLADKDESAPGVTSERSGYSISLVVIEKDKDEQDLVPHTFLAFTDPDGNETVLGFYPKKYHPTSKVLGPGEIRDDERKLADLRSHKRDGALHTVEVTEEQYQEALQEFQNLDGTTYFLGGRNCSTKACEIFTEATGDNSYKGILDFNPDSVLAIMVSKIGSEDAVVGFGKNRDAEQQASSNPKNQDVDVDRE